MMNNKKAGLSGAAKDGPDTIPETFPSGGITDPRWEAFEERYRDYIIACINEKDPECGCAAHDILLRFRTFFNNVLPSYQYRPNIERFRMFIRRFVFATIEHVRSQKGGMRDYGKEFKCTQKSCDADLNWTYEELVPMLARDIVLASERLTEDQRYIFKAIVVEQYDKVQTEDLISRFGLEKVNEFRDAGLALCAKICDDILKGGPDYFGAA